MQAVTNAQQIGLYQKGEKEIAVKYENIYFISVVQSLFIFSLKQTYWFSFSGRKSRLASIFFAEARKWPRYKAQMMPELLLHDGKKLRESLTTLLKSHIKQVVLFCDHKDLITIMNEVGNHNMKLNSCALFHEHLTSAGAKSLAKEDSQLTSETRFDNCAPQSWFQLRRKRIDNFL